LRAAFSCNNFIKINIYMLQHLFVMRRVYILLFIISGSACAAAQTASLQSPVFSNNTPVKKIYDDDAKSWYAAYITGNIIYVYLAITDPQQQRKIVNNGIELWIDPKGKRNKKTSIAFPLINRLENSKPVQGPLPGFGEPAGFGAHNESDTNNTRQLEAAINSMREMKLTGFKEDLNGVQNIHHPSGIDVSLYFMRDTLVYEAQLPVNTLSEPLLVNSRISVCFVEKGMPMPDFGGNQMPPESGSDGMPPPGEPPPGGEDSMHLFRDDVIWYKLVLPNTGIL
ncbi:MAG: hypothetical protein ABUT20_49495, partial [Bacteroidota bacterium]